MKTAAEVDKQILEWMKPAQGLTKAEAAVKIAEACMGWPYVFGARGQYCTPSVRKSRSAATGGAEGEVIIKKCQALNGSKADCGGCKWYPGGGKTRCYDCRGFTYWVMLQVGIRVNGAGATSQWNDGSNWAVKGEIANIPMDKVCCVFMKKGTKMSHTGIHIGGGAIIHCSAEVKRGKITDRGWTHWAIPVGLEGDIPVPDVKPTLRNGSRGQYVTLLQTMLIQRGYDLSPYGADGAFGNRTMEAVKAFQTDCGLKADGIVGEKTWAALESGTRETYTVTVQQLSRTVAEEIIKKYGGTMTREGD